MGLIGSLEELGLVDVLQMIGLARKTGLLQLQTQHSAGAIVVREGLVWGACLRDGPSDLRSLRVGCGLVDPSDDVLLQMNACASLLEKNMTEEFAAFCLL